MKAASFAKINLSLEILGKRPDGYHDISSVFQLINLYDEIDITVLNSGEVRIISNNPNLPTDESNLCYKAAKIMLGFTDHNLGIEINILKNIPISAGLGGGSSNAAVTFLILNHLLNLSFSTQKLIDISKSIGADIPFFITQYSTAKVDGIGEIISNLPTLDNYPTALIIPKDNKESTESAYKNLVLEDLDMTGSNTKSLVQKIIMRSFHDSIRFIHNDFEKTVFKEIPYLKSIKNLILTRYKPIACSLTGSGPLLFTIFRYQDEFNNFIENFKNDNVKIIKTSLYKPK